MKTTIYLDSCALLRPWDIPDQARVAAEAEAIGQFLLLVRRGELSWLASEVLEEELLANPDEEIRSEVLITMKSADRIVQFDESIQSRALDLERLGYGAFDALHLASAERGRADLLLTTDDRFLRRAVRNLGFPSVKLQNPVKWRQEYRP